jgi:hypothetical protein
LEGDFVVCIIFVIGFLSVFDLSATVEWITKYGTGMEANPWMRELWTKSPGIFVFSKIICTIFFCFIAYKLRDNRLMKAMIWLPLTLYTIVSILHIALL